MQVYKDLCVFVNKIYNANGPAQILSYSFWGVLIAGMLWGYEGLPDELLLAWGGVSLLVLFVAVWGRRIALMYTLLLDMVLSMIVLALVLTCEPEYTTQIVYNVMDNGNFIKLEGGVSQWFLDVALVWMVVHSAYLANLIHRQILEFKRFNK